MCLAKVYVEKEGQPSSREAVLSDVAWMEVEPHRLLLRDLLGKEKIVQGRIATVNFLESTVTITRDGR